eukprot:Sdes_comp15312_c0_seq2m4170
MVQIKDIQPHEEEKFLENEDYDETLLERICAIKEIIPEHHRAVFCSVTSWLTSYATKTLFLGGKAAWILSTTALILVVPLGMEVEKEQMLTMYEQEEAQKRQLVNPESMSALPPQKYPTAIPL